MNTALMDGWSDLRHQGLLLDPARLRRIAADEPPQLWSVREQNLRKHLDRMRLSRSHLPDLVSFVFVECCGFQGETGTWQRGPQIGPQWSRTAVSGEAVKPRQLWVGRNGAVLPVFFDEEVRLGIGRGRRMASRVVHWLRQGGERLAVLTNGRQWRLVFAALDIDAWCEWDADLWFEEGASTRQFHVLRSLLTPALLTPPAPGEHAPLVAAILDSRAGQAELSATLGERVREAVEVLVRAHGHVFAAEHPDLAAADIYRAAVRVVMRLVVVLFAESRGMLPRDNPIYHGSYGLAGLRDRLALEAGGRGERLAQRHAAWPRVLALFRLMHQGAHHPDLAIPAYGGDLFAAGSDDARDPLQRALAVFEQACFRHELLSDRDVHRMLDLISRTTLRIARGRGAQTRIVVPVDFSDLSSEYIGILYEGLLDYELRTAAAGDPVIFLNVGTQPALPLSRLESMSDKALADLFEALKTTDTDDDTAPDADPTADSDSGTGDEGTATDPADDTAGDDADTDTADDTDAAAGDTTDPVDPRHLTRSRAETWARRAVVAARLVRPPRARTEAARAAHDDTIARMARTLVARVILPGEWYLVRWGGTRKGSGTFYTRPALAVPTVQRTLRPLAYDPPVAADGTPDTHAPAAAWTPKTPEQILALNVCDPACGSGTFPVAALRFLTDAVYESLHHHRRITDNPGGSVATILRLPGATPGSTQLHDEHLPCRADDPDFEPRTKALLRRHVVERCIHGVDLDPLAVELCRIALWIETMDRSLPFGFLDHKIKCGNSLVGAWFDTFRHYPVMAWKNRDGGDRGHGNGVHHAKGARTQAMKEFVEERLRPDLLAWLGQPSLFDPGIAAEASDVHARDLALLDSLHDMPVHDSAARARRYRDEFEHGASHRALREAMDLWCAVWFWPADELDAAPLPTTFHRSDERTWDVAARVAAARRFFHWELEFPDVFRGESAGFDAILGNPPWDIAKPNSKEFFSNLDPLYRSYGKQAALDVQRSLFAEQSVEANWLDYNADFRALSNYVACAAAPFGDPATDEATFSIQRGKANSHWHAVWRKARMKAAGYADARHPFRHQGSSDLNLYKLFLEQAHALLAPSGGLGFIVPSGIYSDHGTSALRTLFLDHCAWEWIFGFENREKVFDIDSRFKFNPIIVRKGGRTEAMRTAFMRRALEDWERADEHATAYTREQVLRFSPHSRALLEIQSARDLEILAKIYENGVLLGDQGPDGWGVTYAREFDMTNDSKLFPPRPEWEAKGYRPDEYSRWLLGAWRPIDELWSELGVDPTHVVPLDPTCTEQLATRAGAIERTGWRLRCAQPPYDTLPIPRADIPAGIILSRDADAYLHETTITSTALPLYEGRMIGQFDYSQKGWVSGKGRSAVWREVPWSLKVIEPQYLIGLDDWQSRCINTHLEQLKREMKDRFNEKIIKTHLSNIQFELENTPQREIWWRSQRHRLALIDVTSSTNTRTTFSCVLSEMPCGNSAPVLTANKGLLALSAAMNTFAYDTIARYRCAGVHLNWFVLSETVLPAPAVVLDAYEVIAARLLCASARYSEFWVTPSRLTTDNLQSFWSITKHERLRMMCILDVLSAKQVGLNNDDVHFILDGCDVPLGYEVQRNPKGFWRVDKDKDPELRQTVLTIAAFHDLERHIAACGGDREAGIRSFLAQNDGEGWMLPETLRLADYGLGHDDRAREHQPVASRLGARFLDWQLAQTSDESWRECHLHARNLLGQAGYDALLAGGATAATTAEAAAHDPATASASLTPATASHTASASTSPDRGSETLPPADASGPPHPRRRGTSDPTQTELL